MKIWSVLLTVDTPQQEAVANSWRPPVDVYRRGNDWLLKFDLAGVRPADVHILIAGRRITLSGVRRDWVVEQGYSYHSMEINYNRFERCVELPVDLTDAGFDTESRDGWLLVYVRGSEQVGR